MNKADCICELKWLRGVYAGMRKEYGSCVEALDMAINALEQNTWIPCSERLPDTVKTITDDSIGEPCTWSETDWLLGCDNCGEMHIVTMSIEEDGTIAWDGMHDYGYKIVAWMELPEPWKGETDD